MSTGLTTILGESRPRTVGAGAAARPWALVVCLPAFVVSGCVDVSIESQNSPPNVAILEPAAGAVFSVYDTIRLRATVADRMTGSDGLRHSWASSLDGLILEGGVIDGEAAGLFAEPSAGEHQLTLTALDGLGLGTTATVSVTVTSDESPECTITAPPDGAVLHLPGPFLVQAQVGDDHTESAALGVQWSTDVQGLLAETPAVGAGVATATLELEPGEQQLTLTVTDTIGQACQRTHSVRINTPPALSPLSIEPSPPSITSPLVATFAAAPSDEDGDAITLTHRWFLEDAEQVDLTGGSVPFDRLSRDQHWRVEVMAADSWGAVSGPAVAEAVIPDSPPTAPVVTVDPLEPTQVEDLHCSVLVDSVDPDPGDLVSYTFEWQLDGAPTLWTGPTLPASATEPGELWTCVVTPDDGTLAGPSASFSTLVTEACMSLAIDAIGQRVEVPSAPAYGLLSGDFTLEAWVRPESWGPEPRMTLGAKRGPGLDDGWFFGVMGTGGDTGTAWFQPRNEGPGAAGSTVLELGQWTHVALTYDSTAGAATWWIDGAFDAQAFVAQPLGGGTAPVEIGDGSFDAGPWSGLIDDFAVHSGVRYAVDFVPPFPAVVDANTILAFGFEDALLTTTVDVSGVVGAVQGGALFSTDSSCDVNFAPSDPEVSLLPAWPGPLDDLTCVLTVPSVDPEGASISYSGEFWVDGVPSGFAFSSLPATVPASATDDGEQWTCRATASDGSRSSVTASDSKWVGSFLICELSTPASSAATESCAVLPPIPGRVRMEMANADASRDGVFLADAGAYGTTWLGTGTRSWSYAGSTVIGWTDFDVELVADPSMGTLVFDLSYDPAPGVDRTGIDSLTLSFVYGGTIDTAGASLLASQSSAPTSNTITQVGGTVLPGQRLIVEATGCGFGGGAQGFYGDGNSTPADDGFFRMDTGWPETCNLPLRSLSFPPGTHTFTIGNEDDYFADNTGTRAVSLWLQ